MIEKMKGYKVLLFIAGLIPAYEAKAIDWSGKVGIGPSFGFSEGVILLPTGLQRESGSSAGFSINYGIANPVRIGIGTGVKRLSSSLEILGNELNASSFELGIDGFLTFDFISKESSCIYLFVGVGYNFLMLTGEVIAEGVGTEIETTGSGLGLGTGIGFETLISNNFGIAFELGLLNFSTGNIEAPIRSEEGENTFIKSDINQTNFGISPSFSISGRIYF